MAKPQEILKRAFEKASENLSQPIISHTNMVKRIREVCRNKQNRAGVRFLMACLLAKIHNPGYDIRKPYTEIGDPDSYSGRTYDESYISGFITKHGLPCNPTTAFLTPAFRNRNITLTPDLELVGRPPLLYENVLELLAAIHADTVPPDDLLAEIVRCLLGYRNERRKRLQLLLKEVGSSEGMIPLSSEGIVKLIVQHLQSPRSSRLPVLVIAAAYKAAEKRLEERVLPLKGHTAADEQTGALGDLEITLLDDDDIVTSYEMKARQVSKDDINRAIQKIRKSKFRIDNYIFITSDVIEREVKEYAESMYEKLHGIEFVILDCIGFLRHFLHLFHRLRLQFLEEYQGLLLKEPESAVRQELKEVFLALRQAAESGHT